jgi:hypothetical protein
LKGAITRGKRDLNFLLFGSYYPRQINETINKLKNFQYTYTENHVCVRPTLDDVDFSCPHTQTALMGGYYETPSDGLEVRNDFWWKEHIEPLLHQRLLHLCDGEMSSSTLLMYGRGHNKMEHGILHRIRSAGFQIWKLYRHGFLPFEGESYLFPKMPQKKEESPQELLPFSPETERLLQENFFQYSPEQIFSSSLR